MNNIAESYYQGLWAKCAELGVDKSVIKSAFNTKLLGEILPAVRKAAPKLLGTSEVATTRTAPKLLGTSELIKAPRRTRLNTSEVGAPRYRTTVEVGGPQQAGGGINEIQGRMGSIAGRMKQNRLGEGMPRMQVAEPGSNTFFDIPRGAPAVRPRPTAAAVQPQQPNITVGQAPSAAPQPTAVNAEAAKLSNPPVTQKLNPKFVPKGPDNGRLGNLLALGGVGAGAAYGMSADTPQGVQNILDAGGTAARRTRNYFTGRGIDDPWTPPGTQGGVQVPNVAETRVSPNAAEFVTNK